MELTAENYYDNATSFDYMSTSLYKDFRKCEAFALAKLNGEYMPVMDPTALLVGNYVHSYFESEASHSAFIEKNKDAMMTKSGTLRAPYKVGDNMIKCLEADQVFTNLYSVGEKEVIVTGDIFGQRCRSSRHTGITFRWRYTPSSSSRRLALSASRSSSRCQSRHHATMTLSVSIPNRIRSISRRLWKTSRNIRSISLT